MSADLQLEAMKGYFQSMFRDTELKKPSSAPGPAPEAAAPERAPLPAREPLPEAEPEARPVLEAEPETEERKKLRELIAAVPSVGAAAETRTETAAETVTETETAAETVTETAEETQTETAAETETETQAETETAVASETGELVSEKHLAGVREEQEAAAEAAAASSVKAEEPEWNNIRYEGERQCLFFTAGGIKLAVRLADLGGISNMAQITRMPGPAWYLGMMPVRDRKFRIVDTVKWMVPESDQSALAPYRYVIHLGSSGWAIGCHELLSSEKVDGESVKWRETPGQRPWLAGIVKTKMCVLLNVEELVKLLEQGVDIRS
jgi:purine-binding chemotaxis protein CheW